MSIEAIRNFLKENAKGNQELSETHIDEYIAAETEKVKAEEKRIFQAEASKIRKDIDKFKPYKAALEEVGFDGTVEISEFIESLKKVKDNGSAVKTDLEKKLDMVNRQVLALTEENKKATEKTIALERERKTGQLKEKLMKDIGEKLLGGEAHVKALLYENAVDFDEDGRSIVFKNGDALEAYDTGVKKYIEAHKADMKDLQKGGGGTSPANRPVNVSQDMKPIDMLRLPSTK